jgi:hypothetical protein
MRYLKTSFVILFVAMTCSAQVFPAPRPQDTSPVTTFTAKGVIPVSPATLATATVYVDAIVLVNNSASNVTVRIRDRSTDCSNGPCQLVSDDLVIMAGSTYPIPLYGVAATGGITWSASDGTAIVGRITGRY